MEQFSPPIKAIIPERCFRNEDIDASHENTFFQLEGIVIDGGISVANLIYTMETMLSKIFEKKITVRLRPGYFPFVEPGFAFGLGLTRLAMTKYGILDIRVFNSGSLKIMKQFK